MAKETVQQRIAKALQRDKLESAELEELIKAAQSRIDEIRERISSLRSGGYGLTEEKKRLLLFASPQDLVDAEREALLLEAELTQLREQEKLMRSKVLEARVNETPRIVGEELKKLPKLISELKAANAAQRDAEQRLKGTVQTLQTWRGRLDYAKRRKCPAVDDEVFEQLRTLLWRPPPPGPDARGAAVAANRARLALCFLTGEEEQQLADGDWAGKQQQEQMA